MSQGYQHILAVVDPKHDEQPALERAVFLAKKYKAKITLFCCEYDSSIVVKCFLDAQHLQNAEEALVRKRERWLDGYAKSVRTDELDVDVYACWGRNLYESIMHKADELNCDLIIKGTHKHPTIEKLFFNPTDWQLLKSCPQPLLLAKKQKRARSNVVVVAIDPMEVDENSLNKQLMQTSIDFAKSVGAELHVVHSYHLLAWDLMREVIDGAGGYYVGVDNHQEYSDKTQALHREKLMSFLDNYDVDLENVHLVEGDPEDSIISVTRSLSASYLVVGTVYRTGLLGSTAERILDNAECDVIAVKPDGFEPPKI